MDWLFDSRRIIYLLLATVLVILAALWWRLRDRRLMRAIVVVFLIAGVFALVDLVLRRETDREQLQRKVREVAQSLQNRASTSKLGEHLSESFLSKGKRNKARFVEETARLYKVYDIQQIDVSDFRDFKIDRDKKTASARFNVAARSGSNADTWFTAACELEFVLEQDGQWRMRGYKIYWPLNSTDEYTGSELP